MAEKVERIPGAGEDDDHPGRLELQFLNFGRSEIGDCGYVAGDLDESKIRISERLGHGKSRGDPGISEQAIARFDGIRSRLLQLDETHESQVVFKREWIGW